MDGWIGAGVDGGGSNGMEADERPIDIAFELVSDSIIAAGNVDISLDLKRCRRAKRSRRLDAFVEASQRADPATQSHSFYTRPHLPRFTSGPNQPWRHTTLSTNHLSRPYSRHRGNQTRILPHCHFRETTRLSHSPQSTGSNCASAMTTTHRTRGRTWVS